MCKKPEGRLIGKPGTDIVVDLSVDGQSAMREAQQAAVLDALRVHGILGRAADAAGISRSALRAWRNADPVFDQQVMEAIEEACDYAETVLVDLLDASREDVRFQAAKFILQNKRREIYGTKVEMTHDKKQETRYISRVPRPQIIEATGELRPEPEEPADS